MSGEMQDRWVVASRCDIFEVIKSWLMVHKSLEGKILTML